MHEGDDTVILCHRALVRPIAIRHVEQLTFP
jgi:hypothetical protein